MGSEDRCRPPLPGSTTGRPSSFLVLLSLLLMCNAAHAAGLYGGGEGNRRSRCERITIPMCRDMPYNMTRMPNLLDDKTQADAGIRIHEFQPLVEFGCSKHLKFFLCSLFAPMCTEQVDIPIPSCKAICEEVKTSCYPILQKFNFQWPSMLNCSRLPVPEKNICMQFPNVTERAPERAGSALPATGHVMNKLDNEYFGGTVLPGAGKYHPGNPGMGKFDVTTFPRGGTPAIPCPRSRFVLVDDVHGEPACTPRCGTDVYFRRADKEFAEIWMAFWSILCFLSTLFTVCTFWIDVDRFKYPERPIIFLSMCCLFYSSAFIFRMFTGPEAVACDKTANGDTHIILEGLENTRCIVVFLLLYYFGMAGSIWWVVLTLTWYLSAGKKWGHEAIEAWGSYFHMVAWGVPAIKTIVVLTLRRVEGDELTGLCYLDHYLDHYLVIAPLSIYAVLGVLFLLLGFVALFRIRNVMKHTGKNIAKLEKLMVRIGIFSGLYAVPALCVLICHVYERWNYGLWKTVAIVGGFECDAGSSNCQLRNSIPSVEVFMLKILMSLIVGITSGVWIWSTKTWHSWRNFFYYRCSRKYRNRKSLHLTAYSVPPSVLAPLNPPQQRSHQQQSGQQTNLANGQPMAHSHLLQEQQQLQRTQAQLQAQAKSCRKAPKLSHLSKV